MSDIYEIIAIKLRVAREKAGLTQTELSKLTGLKTSSTISALENKTGRTSLYSLNDIAEALNIDIKELL